MKHVLLLILLLLAPLFALGAELTVYPAVPGLAPSEYYKVRVRLASNGNWQDLFTWVTACKTIEKNTVVEDCDIIYSRAKWHHWTGGRVFNMRGESNGEGGAGVLFRNINIEDPRPTLQQFFLCMTVPKPYAKEDRKGEAGDLTGIHFQNVSIAAPSVLGEPQMLWGQPDARIRNLSFQKPHRRRQAGERRKLL